MRCLNLQFIIKRSMKIIALISVLGLLSIATSQTCLTSYYFTGQRCAPCKANCKCTSEGGCDSCLSGYTFDSRFTSCLQCPIQTDSLNVGCKQCCYQVQGPGFVCSECQTGNGVFLVGGQCIKIMGCSAVSVGGVCSSCDSGFYLSQGICKACDTSCATCHDSNLCLTCAQTYFIQADSDMSLCSSCTLGCKTCSPASTCSDCIQAYYLSSTSCLSCSSNCLTCTAGGCSVCDSDSTLIGSQCYLCTNLVFQGSVGCTTCMESGGNIRCTMCSDGYFLNGATFACQACSSSWPNSIECSPTAPLQCQDDSHATLTSRYYLYGTTCVANINSCKTMSQVGGLCSSCYFEVGAYYRLSSGVCLMCSESGCKTYSSQCVCLSCNDGYQFVNNQCHTCQNQHCITCQTGTSLCQACETTYGLLSTACVECKPTNCLNCDGDDTICTVCDTGYYLNSGQCFTCQSNCLTCISSTQCNSCQAGTFLQSNGRCKTLPTNCLEIDQSDQSLSSQIATCKRCAYGHVIMEGGCYPCSQDLFNMDLCKDYNCPNFYTSQFGGFVRFCGIFVVLIGVLLF